jgi:hypothetical protein
MMVSCISLKTTVLGEQRPATLNPHPSNQKHALLNLYTRSPRSGDRQELTNDEKSCRVDGRTPAKPPPSSSLTRSITSRQTFCGPLRPPYVRNNHCQILPPVSAEHTCFLWKRCRRFCPHNTLQTVGQMREQVLCCTALHIALRYEARKRVCTEAAV